MATVAGALDKPVTVINYVGEPGVSLPARLEAGIGLGEGLRRHRMTIHQAVRGKTVDELLGDAARVAADPAAPLALRVAAVRLLGLDDVSRTGDALGVLLDPRQPAEIQRAAVASIRGMNSPDVVPRLLSRWRSYTPALRQDVIAALLAYKNRIPALLDALEAGRVSPADIPAANRTALVSHEDSAIRTRAAKLFGPAAEPGAGRKEALARYSSSLQLTGDAAAGRKVFEANCVACHRVGDLGNDVGPNLATVRQWSPEQLLTNILDPNREVAPAFTQYVVQMHDGETLSGVVADETGTSITLKMSGGATRVLSRQNVKRVAGSQLSLMPENLEAGIPPQQMADLIAFLRGEPTKPATR
jgi:putative heme-binding domain-containing protein